MNADFFEKMIMRPGAPNHFMQISPLKYPVSVEFQGFQIAYSEQVLCVQEVGVALYRPVMYFPAEDVHMKYLHLSGKKSTCPLKGVTDYYDIQFENRRLQNVGWTYNAVYDFDSRLECLEGKLAFDHNMIRINELTDVVMKRKSEDRVNVE
ncbi:hypothetical protein A9Q99_25490 [Gammaproteobacteria bacterium 45_16_T64]|nr:hypothetical protein A9Q99_25490 [Gammaproteobacteria bacterium 45_16_T64]